jgi:hypothetical protein
MHNMIGMETGYENATHVDVMIGSIVFAHLQMCYDDVAYCFTCCWCTPSYPEKGR